MFGVKCFDTHDKPISHYTQWDINQTLKIVLYGMDDGYMKNAPYVHFANIKSSEALVVPSTLQGDNTIIVDIPNILLQELWPLLVYVYLSDSTDASSQRTIVKIEIPVHKRARPSNYEYVENIDRITAEVIKQEIYDDIMDEVHSGNLAYPYVTFIDESTGKHVNLKVSDEKFGLYVDSTNRQLLDTGDIVNNLMTNSSTKVLSASMGAAIKNMVDVIPDQIDEKIEEHDSSPTSHSDIRDDISSVSSAVDTMQDSIAEIENKIDDVMLDDTISGSGILTTTDTLVDSSPIEMRVKGRTVQNLWVNPSGTSSGVTLTDNDDGSVTISGTAAGGVTIGGQGNNRYILKPSTTYTLSIDKATSQGYFDVREFDSAGSVLGTAHTASVEGTVFTTDANMAYVYMRFLGTGGEGTEYSGTYRIMLNEGSEAQPWCPPGLNGVDELSIVTAGKNLATSKFYTTKYSYGYVVGFRNEGSRAAISLPYTNSDAYAGVSVYFYAVKGQTYKFTQVNAPEGAILRINQFYEGQSIVGGSPSGNTGAFAYTGIKNSITFKNSGLCVVLSAMGNNSTGNTWPKDFGIQIEVGSTATAYEPPNVTTTPIDLDGHALHSLPDGTCDELTIDATGAVTLTKLCGLATIDGDATYNASVLTDNIRVNANKSSIALSKAPYDNTRPEKFPTSNGNAKLGQIVSSGSHVVSTYIPKELADTTDAAIDFVRGHEPYSIVYPLATPQTIPLTAVTLPTLPSDKSNIYAASNVPTAGLTVRYWKKGGELVANLYKLLQNHEA